MADWAWLKPGPYVHEVAALNRATWIRTAALLLLLSISAVGMVRAHVPLRASLKAIELYREYASPLLTRAGVRCRFTPTCSRYATAVLQKHGFVRGSLLTVRRIARCGPWTPAGTVDPP